MPILKYAQRWLPLGTVVLYLTVTGCWCLADRCFRRYYYFRCRYCIYKKSGYNNYQDGLAVFYIGNVFFAILVFYV